MTVPHRRSLFAALPSISLVALIVFASPAAAQRKDHLLSASPPTTLSPLACDVTVVDSIVDPAELDTFTIVVPVDQVIAVSLARLDPNDTSFYPAWRLRDVHQQLVPPYTSFGQPGNHLRVPLPASGSPYRLEVADLYGNGVGNYAVRIERLTEGQACEGFNLACDAPHTDSLTSIIDSDLFRFTAANGETVSVTVVGEPPLHPGWRLLDASGTLVPVLESTSLAQWPAATLCGPLSAAAGPYRIEVADVLGDATGRYRVYLQRVTALTACETTRLPCDSLIVATLTDSVATDLYRFNASGDVVSISVAAQPGGDTDFKPAWRVLNSTGAPVAGFEGTITTHANPVRVGPLPALGSPYRVQVGDDQTNATGVYEVRLERLTDGATCEGTILTCGVAVTDSLENDLDSDLFSFPAINGENVSVTVVGEQPVQPAWRLLDKSGKPVRSIFNDLAPWSPAILSGPLSAAGSPYRIEVADYAGATGRYRVYMQRVGAVTACGTSPLPCDTMIVVALDDSVATRLHSFNANGDVVSISVAAQPGGDPYFAPVWRVLDRSGTPVDATPVLSYWGRHLKVGPLSVAGNPYRVQVCDNGADATGTYEVRLERLTAGPACEGTSLACDVVTTDSLENREDSDLFSFSATNGEIVSMSVVGESPFQPYWRLVRADGTLVFDLNSWPVPYNCGPLSTAASPYRIEVADLGGTTGRYHVQMQRVTAQNACDMTALACGALTTGLTEDPLDTDLLSFKVQAGESVWVTVDKWPGSGSAYQPAWRLLDSSGEPVGRCGSYSHYSKREPCGVLSPFAGPYVIQVGDLSQDDVGQYGVTVECTRTVGVEDAASATFDLGQSHPNPLTRQTTIQYALASPVHVSLKVYDVSGAVVATLVDRDMNAGFHSVQWNAPGVRSGIYFYRIRAGSYVRTKQLMIVR